MSVLVNVNLYRRSKLRRERCLEQDSENVQILGRYKISHVLVKKLDGLASFTTQKNSHEQYSHHLIITFSYS